MRRGLLLGLVATLVGIWGAGVGFKRDPFGDPLVPGLSGSAGTDATLGYLYQLDDFAGLGDLQQSLTKLWVDPYGGSDTLTTTAGRGSYEFPFRSFSRLKQQCLSGSLCMVKGKDRVFSPLTFVVDGVVVGDQFIRGETLTWAAGASTGTVLDWDGSRNILVIDRDTGTDPDCCAVTFIGSTSGANVTDVSRTDTIGGHPSERVVSFTDAGDLVNIAGHYYTNNEGPMRLFNDGGVLPTNLLENTDYWICTIIAGTSFTLHTNSTCTALQTFTGAGSGTTDITGFSNTLVEDTIVPDCVNANELCIVFDSEFPDHPATVDANGFHVTGLTAQAAPDVTGAVGATPTGGIPHVGGDGSGGWLGWANINQQNMDNKAVFAVTGATSRGKVFSLNSNALAIRDGTNGRSFNDATSAHNNCIAATGGDATTGGGVAWVVNSKCHDYSDSAISSGSSIVPAESAKVVIIGGEYRQESVAANWSAHITMTNGDLVVIGTEFYSSTTVAARLLLFAANAPTVDRAQLARVSFICRSGTAFCSGVQFTPAGVALLSLYETTLAANADGVAPNRAFDLGDFSGGVSRLLARGLLVDDYDLWFETANATTAVTNLDLDVQGIFDDGDTTGPSAANEWNIIGGAGHATRASFETAIRVILADDEQWDIYEAGSFDSAGASTEFVDTVNFRCNSARSCWENYSTPYTIDFTNILHTQPTYSCSPVGVLPGGAQLCSLTLVPTHIGAR